MSKLTRAILKILFILRSYKFLAYLEYIRNYAGSFGHSGPDLSSVHLKQNSNIEGQLCPAHRLVPTNMFETPSSLWS